MPAIEADTGWDRASLSLPYAVYVFLYSALGAASGWATDRWGPRLVIFSGGCLLGGGILLTSQVQELWQLYVTLGLVTAMGMSAAFVPCNSTVVRWFTRRRGLALSISTSGGSMGNFLFPPLAATLIGAYGWRPAYLILGCAGLAIIGLCAMFIVRDPEQLGLSPDGSAASPAQEERDSRAVVGTDYTLAEARKTVSFWLFKRRLYPDLAVRVHAIYSSCSACHGSGRASGSGGHNYERDGPGQSGRPSAEWRHL